MSNQHSYIACVRQNTRNLPDIDDVKPICSSDEACLREIDEVLRKHRAIDRFGINLLHSHFPMAEDEVLLEETDVLNRRQTISIVKKSEVPQGAIYMDHRFDVSEGDRARIMFQRMIGYDNQLFLNKLRGDLELSEDGARLLFQDVKRFLALCSSAPFSLAPPRRIDEAWHQFILLTKDYAAFCAEYCGDFVHHQPADPFAEGKDYGSERGRTRILAQQVYGVLSQNWDETVTGGKCTHNCGNGD